MDYTFSKALAGMNGTATREIFKLTSKPEVISFAGGLPAGDALPVQQLSEIASEFFYDPSAVRGMLQYSVTEGIPGFREVVLEQVKDLGIIGQTVENVLITSGGGQGLDLLCKAFLDPGDAVLVERPTFLGFLQTLNSYNARTVGVEADECGIDLADLEGKLLEYHPKLIYLIPTFSNPTGKTCPLERRKAIIELASRHGAIIMEDDPYGRLRFSGEAVAPMKAMDERGVVVYVSSFSKTISPGLRCGFSIGPSEIIRKMTIGKQGVDLHTATLSQHLIKRYIEKEFFLSNIKRSLPIYKERKDAMMNAIKRYMPDSFKHTDPEGGLFIWGEFMDGTDTSAKFPFAIEKKVAYIQGEVFYAENAKKNALRLNYSNESPERIEAGMKALGQAFS
ncbi:MAG: PLP-dependent aminotransferase family protein [Clostridiales bacterium]|jgi:2-aminoadipate transaminase|nr:PLP-dependent aminotransferase family protein [Clostridiales bacterium]